MAVNTTDQLVASFEEKLIAVKLAFKVRNLPKSDVEKCEKIMVNITSDLKTLTNTFTEIGEEITLYSKKLQQSKEMKIRLDELNGKMEYILTNLPNDLPKQRRNEKTLQPELKMSKPIESKSAKTVLEIKMIRCIEPLKKQEFDSIPKYMKGRLSYSTLNQAIIEFNQAIEKKYVLLNKSQSKVGQFDVTLYKLYKQQETKETKGICFCSRDDLRKFHSFKFDNMTKSILSSLCHCKRIRYLYGAGTTFYAVV